MNNKLWTFSAIYLPGFFWLGVLAYLAIIKDYPTLIFVFVGSVILRAVCEIIYFFYKKPRPYQVLNIIPPSSWLFASPYKTRQDSFPSAHAAVLFFAAFFLLFSQFYWLGILALGIAVLNSFGRVRLFYHYLADIFAGLMLGGIWLIFMVFVARM